MVLITGASGFLGGRLAQILAGRGEAVRVLARENSDLRHLAGLPIEVMRGDAASAVRGITDIYHCAGPRWLQGRAAVSARKHQRRLRLPPRSVRRIAPARRYRAALQPFQAAGRAEGVGGGERRGPAGDGRAAGDDLRAAREGVRHRHSEADPAGADGGDWRRAHRGRILLRGQRRRGHDPGGHGE